MEYNKQIDYLLKLDKYELMGKELLKLRGFNMNYAEYIYCLLHSECNSINDLLSSSALKQQEHINKEYKGKYKTKGLTEKDFFPENTDFIIERLLRYVDIPEHSHQFYELVYVVTGNCVHKIAGEDFNQPSGSFSIIPPTAPHALYPDNDCLCLTLKIKNTSLFHMDIPDLIRFVYPMVFYCRDDSLVRNVFLEMYSLQENYSPSSISYHLLQAILIHVQQNHQKQGQLLTSNSSQNKQIIEILTYAVNNYNTTNLRDVAKHFHYNESYLSNMFKKQTGSSFTSALRGFRLFKAKIMLENTNKSVSDICDQVGYKDLTQFIKIFKKQYNDSPSQYRKKYLNNTN